MESFCSINRSTTTTSNNLYLEFRENMGNYIFLKSSWMTRSKLGNKIGGVILKFVLNRMYLPVGIYGEPAKNKFNGF